MGKRKLVDCPRCDSSNTRSARTRGFIDQFLSLLGFYAFRCSDCNFRFRANPLGVTNAGYAKCPRCLRMDLTTWDPKYYKPSRWTDLKVWLGAHRWRCDPCRNNFVSWRRRKQRYVRPEDRNRQQAGAQPSADYHEMFGS